MKKVLSITLACLICIGFAADATVRNESASSRSDTNNIIAKNTRASVSNSTDKTPARTTTQTVQARTARNNATLSSAREEGDTTSARSATNRNSPAVVTGRNQVTTSARTAINPPKTTTQASASQRITGRNTAEQKTVVRAGTTNQEKNMTLETKTGAAYELCKNSFFTCMDQFCRAKNEDYRRCSCSDRVYNLEDQKEVLKNANMQLTTFTEDLVAVGMTKEQATAMRTDSEGESALTKDSSASKALLQAIMNSIRGKDSNVGGRLSDLNSINISFDTTNAFGIMDTGQAIAAYNGSNLYGAIYGQCKTAVREDCTDAGLQRAVTAYLMAIEQDCNTVQTMIDENQKQMKAAIQEGGAMLDLARIENRQNRNSDDMTTCLSNVESAILSEEVCGENYHKCLDNGDFIDVSTGAPIAGVVKFYELEHLLKFNEEARIDDQKLSKVSNNRVFVQNFESRVKMFAKPSLDKCVEQSKEVWEEYLDKAMIDIYYAQKSKVSEIKQGCFDFVSACYMNGDKSLTAAMSDLIGESSIVLQPDRITLNSAICTEYVDSCDNMFDNGIIKDYVQNREDIDKLTACRAVAKQCFDKFGGTGYENFYYPYSGLFAAGKAADWFSLCDGDAENGECTKYKSECAKQLSKIESCSDIETMKQAFGGLDYINNPNEYHQYGLMKEGEKGLAIDPRALRPSGVATEVYYQIIDILSTQCINVQGRFVEIQFYNFGLYDKGNICLSKHVNAGLPEYDIETSGQIKALALRYGISKGEDMCPRDYIKGVDTESWGACLCWENGARRSGWGKSVKCVNEIPVQNVIEKGENCLPNSINHQVSMTQKPNPDNSNNKWCTQKVISGRNQTCPIGTTKSTSTGKCDYTLINVDRIPEGLK